MSMFHRRRASSNPPPKTPPNAAASTAAVQAFLANRASNANLSNAAAAAALRSRPTTPTPVGDLPTKRRAQRSGSVSSNGSSMPGLQRQNSSGSMTERTFRDPSPNRANLGTTRDDDPPPVPALPKDYVSPPPLPAKSIRRPASVEPPERISSPPPRSGGRGVSLDRGPGVMPGRQTNKVKVAGLNAVGESERRQIRESVNFSRPMSPQNSPPVSPLAERKVKSAASQPQSATQNAARANMGVLRDGEAERIQYSIQETATRPVKKKKKAVAKGLAEGSHLASSGGGSKPTGSALETPQKQTASTNSTPSPANVKVETRATTLSQPVPRKKKKRVASSTSSASSYASDSDSAMSDRGSMRDQPRSFHTRAAGLLVKQPSIVREDKEAEEQEEQSIPGMQSHVGNGTFNPKPAAPATTIPKSTKQHKKSASQPTPLLVPSETKSLDVPGATATITIQGNSNVQQPRPKSLSPGRATHFLAQPMYATPDGVKHQPPERSASPAKSALKHSPSSRGASPMGFAAGSYNRLSGVAGSEASDNGSVISDDGAKALSNKKKSVRVSFDDDSVVMGRASTPPATDSPTLLSPQHKDGPGKGLLAFGRRRNQGGSPNDSDQDTGMKPTPTLPSFGSIRNKNKEESLAMPKKSNGLLSDMRPLLETQTSSDHVAGSVLSNDFATRNGKLSSDGSNQLLSNDLLPPEVTSVEGTGYHSDTDESTHSIVEASRAMAENANTQPVSTESGISPKPPVDDPLTEEKSKVAEEATNAQNSLVPSIAVLPATPGIGSNEEVQEDWFKMPGGFADSNEDYESQEPTSTPSLPPVEHHLTDPTPARLGIAEPEPENTASSQPGSPIVGHVAEAIQQQIESGAEDESDDTGDSIYSDAAEDISDVEGDGFGSINAIMESPPSTKTPFVASLVPEGSNKKERGSKSSELAPASKRMKDPLEPSSKDGWDRTQAYWSGLSRSQREQLERAAVPGAVDDVPTPAKAPTMIENKPKEKKKVKRVAQSSDPPLPPWPDRQDVPRPSSPKVGGMKQSMRSSQLETSQPQMRTSMRNGAPPKSSNRNSIQIPEPKPEPRVALQKKNRPVSAVAMVDYNQNRGKPTVSHDRAASLGLPEKTSKPLAAQPTKPVKTVPRRAKSNGSDSSSSFKKTRPTKPDGGRYTMKRSMRAESADSRPRSSYAGRTESLNARSTSPTAKRPFSSTGSGMRTSLRGSIDSGVGSRTRSPPRGFGFGKNTKTRAPAKSAGSHFSSRFGDSSDEDEGPVKLSSRFADSSDDEDTAGLTPVRGIPRRIDEGDSTDLDDSSTPGTPTLQPKSKPPPPATQTNALEGAPEQGTGLQAKKAAEREKKKRSFFGSRSKKQAPPLSISAPTPASPSSPKSPKAGKLLGSSVAASSPQQASPRSPKLQRRNTPMRLASDSWPLPEMPGAAAAEKARPNTSDGAGKSARPLSGPRRFTAENGNRDQLAPNGVVAAGKEGKKKRFPMLRKALGL